MQLIFSTRRRAARPRPDRALLRDRQPALPLRRCRATPPPRGRRGRRPVLTLARAGGAPARLLPRRLPPARPQRDRVRPAGALGSRRLPAAAARVARAARPAAADGRQGPARPPGRHPLPGLALPRPDAGGLRRRDGHRSATTRATWPRSGSTTRTASSAGRSARSWPARRSASRRSSRPATRVAASSVQALAQRTRPGRRRCLPPPASSRRAPDPPRAPTRHRG